MTRSPASLVGTIVAERYRIDGLLGEGGMGAVYRAQHIHMQKAFAIKIMHHQMTAIEGSVKRFERESIAAARIEHPNVAAAIDFGQLDEGSFYFVLEYLPGQTLAKLLASRRALPLGRALFIARQVAAALGAAHAVGIVHRDLKPDNVMLIEKEGVSDHVKVLDFGIAKIASDASQSTATLTQTGSIFGTPRYMAPEQAAGRAVDARADLYALGLILHEMLSGKPVFDSNEILPLLMKQVNEAPPLLPARVPPDLSALVMELLQKDPANRPQSAEHVVRRIDALAEGSTPAPESAPGPALASSEKIAAGQAQEATRWLENAVGRAKVSVRDALPSMRDGLPSARDALPSLRRLFALPKQRAAKPLKERVLTLVAGSARARRSNRRRRAPLWRESVSTKSKKAGRSVARGASELMQFARRRSAGRVPNWVWAAIAVTTLAVFFGLRSANLLSWAALGWQPEADTGAPAYVAQDGVRERQQPDAGETTLDPQLQRLIADARQGSDSALYALELRSEHERSQHEWLALAQGRLKRRQVAEALKAYDRALRLDSSLAGDTRMLSGLRYFADRESTYEPVLEFAAEKLGPTGADLIFHVWSATNRTTSYTTKAKALLEDDRVRKNMSKPLRLAMDVRDAHNCDDLEELVQEILKNGDERCLARLLELSKVVGCGSGKKRDCYPCLRDSSLLAEAIAQVQTRRAPRFGVWR